ncbi:MAG: prolipoprotein diacylglyceryl transferase [Pirellulaceae bacterium]
MRQTFFYIPHEIAGVSVFGFGWMLLAWCLFSVGLLLWMIRRHGWSAETRSVLPMLAVVAIAICFILPILEVGSQGGPLALLRQMFSSSKSASAAASESELPRGLPIRGYGVLMLLGVVSGVGLAAQRARRVGLNPDVIFSLAFWMFLGGIAGARAFYVIQKWDEFRRPTLAGTIGEILKFTEGGLVVYGSLIGALCAVLWFCHSRRLSALALGDLIAPSMAVGLAFGRIGCLMNGCCWGGACENPWLGITFPPSPPYLQQLHEGELLGLRLARPAEDRSREVLQVEEGSLADRAGLRAGDRVTSLRYPSIDALREALSQSSQSAPHVVLDTSRGPISFPASQLPARSRPVHPTQIYSSVNAALLAFMLWVYFPFRRRDGEVFAWMLTIYPVTRFLLESIRIDEAGAMGTAFSISQLVSLGMLAVSCLLWAVLLARPRHVSFARYPGASEAAAAGAS